MSFRRILFWSHLAAGLAAGLVIAVMCFTGATLAFEKQLVAWSERDARVVDAPAAGTTRLTIDQLAAVVRTARPEARPTSITVSADPRAAVAFSFGRDETAYANPYSGEIRSPASTRMRDFLHTMEQWHRWLALPGSARGTGKLINGVANAAFLVLAVTGLYLWLPRTWSRRGVRAVAVLNLRLTGRARDFNWHNALGLWCAPVLIVLTLTALPMSFRWANALVYILAGDTSPAPGGPGGPGGFGGTAIAVTPPSPDARPLDYEALLQDLRLAHPQWTDLTLRLGGAGPRGDRPPEAGAGRDSAGPRRNRDSAPGHGPRELRTGPSAVTFIVKEAGAWPRTASTTISVDPFTGEVLRTEAFGDLSAGRRVRGWTRFLHTGEALGWIGQLVAGLACVGGCVLAYTGFALSWRRFFGRRSAAD